MLIRSQDKRIIINMNSITTIDVVGNSIVAFNEVDNCNTIGEYSTKERAMKVLDMIQICYRANKYAEAMNKTPSINNTYVKGMPFGSFQMPQESEVE